MKDFRITIRLLAPTGTPWQSDTIFGHLAWQVAHGAASVPIDEFLQPFRAGQPPFVLSDAFPYGLLPRPAYPMPPEAEDIEGYQRAKAREKTLFVTHEEFQAIRRGDIGQWQQRPDPWLQFDMLRASLHRFTETTTGELIEEGQPIQPGALFLSSTMLPASSDRRLDIYLRARDDSWAEIVYELLCKMAPLGFGRDRSVGLGAFEVLEIQPTQAFEPFDEANGFISLSTYVPAAGDPSAGFWRIRLKYGKLGEMASPNPFKRPLVQLEPGAVFLTDGPPKPFYGRAVEGIAPGMPEAIQCCFTIAAPCRVPDEVVEEMQV